MLNKISLLPRLLSISAILLPLGCIVCSRPLRNALLCWRCRPVPTISPVGLCKICYSHSVWSNSSAPVICQTCEAFPPLFDTCCYLWEYDRVPRDLIRSMKFNASPRLARALGGLLAENLINHSSTSPFSTSPFSTVPLSIAPLTTAPSRILPWDAITFIPTSYRSGLSRRFNQCELMAHTISSTIEKQLGTKIPVIELLRRSFKRAPHSTLPHQKRLSRLKSLFRSSDGGKSKRILLIEDVVTTGATISAACFALRKTGVEHITVASLARSATWNQYRAAVYEKTVGL